MKIVIKIAFFRFIPAKTESKAEKPDYSFPKIRLNSFLRFRFQSSDFGYFWQT